jgi:hypothetical protein
MFDRSAASIQANTSEIANTYFDGFGAALFRSKRNDRMQ